MTNKAVMEMLRRPMKQAPAQNVADMSGGAFHERYLKEFAKEAGREATERMQLVLDAATARAIAAEKECDTLKGIVDSTGKQIDMLTLANTRLAIECDKESSAKDAANNACDAAGDKTSGLNKRVAELTASLAEVNKHNTVLQKTLLSITSQTNKPAAPVMPTVIPEFEFVVTSRDHNGTIKTLSAKPKR